MLNSNIKINYKKILNWIIAVIVLITLSIIAYYSITIYSLFLPDNSVTISDNEKLETSLKMGRLSVLPKNITEFKIANTSNTFSSTYIFKFKSNKQDINKFILESPSLKNQDPKILNVNTNNSTSESVLINRNTNFDWFNPTIKSKGRMYTISVDDKSNYGVVIIDDLENIVYITISHS